MSVLAVIDDAGCASGSIYKRFVFSRDDWGKFVRAADQNNLVVAGANQQELLQKIASSTSKPAIAAIKRAPSLKRFGRVSKGRWLTRLSPADYAGMMQGLRLGA